MAQLSAAALSALARTDRAGLVPACRQLVARHLENGPVWWMASRVLCSDDPARAAREAEDELASDPTPAHLEEALPEGATVLVVGWPELAGLALARRGDVEVLVADADGQGAALARRLARGGIDVALVEDRGVGAGAVAADIVLVEALAAGPSGLLAPLGSHAAAALAQEAWGVAGVGRVLPEELWTALLERFDGSGCEPWERGAELVPVGALKFLVGPGGLGEVGLGLAATTCPAAPELLVAGG